MKKTRLVALGLGALSIAGLVGAGVGLSANNNVRADEVKADSTAVTIENNQRSNHTFFIDMSGFTDWVSASNNEYFAVKFSKDDSAFAWTSPLSVGNAKGNILPFNIPMAGSDSVEWTKAKAVRLETSNVDGTIHNQTGEIDISSGTVNAIKITGWDAGEASTVNYGLNSGTSVYLNYNNKDWWNDGEGVSNFNYVCFFNPLSGEAKQVWAKATVMNGTNDSMLQAIVPGTNDSFASMIAVRCKTDVGSWGEKGSNVNNQSSDCHAASTTANGVRNELVIYEDDVWNVNLYSTHLSDESRAIFWGTYFLNQITCGGDTGANAGQITSLDPSAAWNNVRSEFNNASAAVKNIIYDKVGVKEGGNDLETAIYRYDYIVLYKKALDPTTYSTYDDFIDRKTSSNKTSSFGLKLEVTNTNNSSENVLVTTTVIVSSVAVLASAGCFFIRKRKLH